MSTPDNRISAVIYSVRRAPSSTNGNPSYFLMTSAGKFRTQTDGQIGYAIGNYTNSCFPDTYVIGNPANPEVTLLCTARNSVYGIERDGKILR